jgi:hypothetical protein
LVIDGGDIARDLAFNTDAVTEKDIAYDPCALGNQTFQGGLLFLVKHRAPYRVTTLLAGITV